MLSAAVYSSHVVCCRLSSTISVMNLDGPKHFRRDILGYNEESTGVGKVVGLCVDPTRG